MMHGFGFGGFGMIFMGIFWVVAICLIIWGAVRMGRYGCCMPSSRTNQNALDIAKERYAKGEINKEELDRLKRDLS
jgi:putative membrane protein